MEWSPEVQQIHPKTCGI